MSYVAATLVDNTLGKFICGIYPECAPDEPLGDEQLGIVIRNNLDEALDGVGLILMLLKTKTAEVRVDPDQLAAYIEDAALLLRQLTRLGEKCEEKLQQEIDDLQDVLDEDAVDEVFACDCPLCEEENESI